MIKPNPDDKRDGGSEGVARPDAHGQAALLLVESLIHGLIARSVISVEDAVEIVSVAFETQEDIAGEMNSPSAAITESLRLLGGMHASLANDLPDTGSELAGPI